MIDKTNDDVLVDDGSGQIYLVRDTGFPKGFAIGIRDGSGFSTVLLTVEQWDEMKAKVDKFNAGSKPEEKK